MQIERKRGDTYPDVFTVRFSTKPRGLVNLSGCSFKMTLSTIAEPEDVSTQLYQIEGVVVDPATGKVEFSPTAEQANRVGYFFYDVEMTDSYGKVHTLASDSYNYKQDITK